MSPPGEVNLAQVLHRVTALLVTHALACACVCSGCYVTQLFVASRQTEEQLRTCRCFVSSQTT